MDLENLKKITLFRGGPWVRARDWNWHNVLGFWCAVPLLLIVVTGVIMSYRVGQQPSLPHDREYTAAAASSGRSSERLRSSGDVRSGKTSRKRDATIFDGRLEKLFARAGQQVPDGRPSACACQTLYTGPLTFSIDRGDGGRPDLRSQLTLDPASGEIVRWEPFSSYNRGRQLAPGPDSLTPAKLGAGWADPRRHRLRGRFPAGVYRALAWVRTAPWPGGAAGLAFEQQTGFS